MYTECVIGCSLKPSDKEKAILDYLMIAFDGQDTAPIPEGIPPEFLSTRISWMLRAGGSYYFGSPSGEVTLNLDTISQEYRFSARFNIKNYNNEIETFLAWLEPMVTQGSGQDHLYAYSIYEEAKEPTLYYKKSLNNIEQ